MSFQSPYFFTKSSQSKQKSKTFLNNVSDIMEACEDFKRQRGLSQKCYKDNEQVQNKKIQVQFNMLKSLINKRSQDLNEQSVLIENDITKDQQSQSFITLDSDRRKKKDHKAIAFQTFQDEDKENQPRLANYQKNSIKKRSNTFHSFTTEVSNQPIFESTQPMMNNHKKFKFENELMEIYKQPEITKNQALFHKDNLPKERKNIDFQSLFTKIFEIIRNEEDIQELILNSARQTNSQLNQTFNFEQEFNRTRQKNYSQKKTPVLVFPHQGQTEVQNFKNQDQSNQKKSSERIYHPNSQSDFSLQRSFYQPIKKFQTQHQQLNFDRLKNFLPQQSSEYNVATKKHQFDFLNDQSRLDDKKIMDYFKQMMEQHLVPLLEKWRNQSTQSKLDRIESKNVSLQNLKIQPFSNQQSFIDENEKTMTPINESLMRVPSNTYISLKDEINILEVENHTKQKKLSAALMIEFSDRRKMQILSVFKAYNLWKSQTFSENSKQQLRSLNNKLNNEISKNNLITSQLNNEVSELSSISFQLHNQIQKHLEVRIMSGVYILSKFSRQLQKILVRDCFRDLALIPVGVSQISYQLDHSLRCQQQKQKYAQNIEASVEFSDVGQSILWDIHQKQQSISNTPNRINESFREDEYYYSQRLNQTAMENCDTSQVLQNDSFSAKGTKQVKKRNNSLNNGQVWSNKAKNFAKNINHQRFKSYENI